MGVATGCGFKEIYRFLHTTYPTPLVSVLFAAASLLFCSFLKCFSFFIYIYTYINHNNTQIAAIVLPPSTTHPQLWAELLTFKPKCTIA